MHFISFMINFDKKNEIIVYFHFLLEEMQRDEMMKPIILQYVLALFEQTIPNDVFIFNRFYQNFFMWDFESDDIKITKMKILKIALSEENHKDILVEIADIEDEKLVILKWQIQAKCAIEYENKGKETFFQVLSFADFHEKVISYSLKILKNKSFGEIQQNLLEQTPFIKSEEAKMKILKAMLKNIETCFDTFHRVLIQLYMKDDFCYLNYLSIHFELIILLQKDHFNVSQTQKQFSLDLFYFAQEKLMTKELKNEQNTNTIESILQSFSAENCKKVFEECINNQLFQTNSVFQKKEENKDFFEFHFHSKYKKSRNFIPLHFDDSSDSIDDMSCQINEPSTKTKIEEVVGTKRKLSENFIELEEENPEKDFLNEFLNAP